MNFKECLPLRKKPTTINALRIASDRTLVATSIVFDGETYRQRKKDAELNNIGCPWWLGRSRALKNRPRTLMVVAVD